MRNKEVPCILLTIITIVAAYGGLAYASFCGIIPLLLIGVYVYLIDKRERLIKVVNIMLVMFVFFFALQVCLDLINNFFELESYSYEAFWLALFYFRIVAFMIVAVFLLLTGRKNNTSKVKVEEEIRE